MERANKPATLKSVPPPQDQATITFSDKSVKAELPSKESVEVLLKGATVISWKDASGDEKLWLSDAADLDGKKAVRGGIPLVFPVFGTAPDHAQTGKLPQHGFARNATWEFMGKSTSESTPLKDAPSGSKDAAADQSVKLDFSLGREQLDPDWKAKWPFDFSLDYSVTLNRESLTTSLVVRNRDEKPFECQVLLHTYLRVNDITQVSIKGLESASYVDKIDGAKTKSEPAEGVVTIAGEVDRVYTPSEERPGEQAVSVLEGGKTRFTVTRDNLANVVVWNPWTDKAAGMADFEPKDGFKNMLCIEPGSVSGWQTLEKGDAFEGAQTISYSY